MGDKQLPVDPMVQFQADLTKRIREDIKDLLPEGALLELVKKAVEQEFFQPKIKKDQYGRVEAAEPSWFVKEVVKRAEPLMIRLVTDTFAEHDELIEKVIKNFLDENKLTILITHQLISHFENLSTEMINKLQGFN